jgi:hypothetical protein
LVFSRVDDIERCFWCYFFYRKVSLKLKIIFLKLSYKICDVIQDQKYYATIMGQPKNKLNVAEIRMLRWMNGHIRQDKIRNDCIRERTS